LEALESHSEEWSPEEIFNYMSYIQPIISILIPILRAANIDIAGISEEKLDELLEVSVLRIDDDKKREEAEQLLTMLKNYPITYRRFLWIVRQLLS
jgi:CRISPR/Cas system CSM-associated protein Csm2 small subunit